MLTPELSLTILRVVIAIIMVFYVTLLVKLKPSEDVKPPSSSHPERVKKVPAKRKTPEKPTISVKTKKIASEEPALTAKTKKVPEELSESVGAKAHVETEKNQKKKKGKQAKRSFFLFGETDFKGCPHKFGYLRTLPKSTPIPDGCFGCPRILECLGSSKKKR
jgi:cytoskeletal protein RodZ